MPKIKKIETEEQYDEALGHAYELIQLDIKENSKISNELNTLSILIKEYESIHHSIT